MVKDILINIYDYDDLSAYLKDVFFKKIETNKNLSLRALANKLDIPSSSAFNQMLRGHRPVPAKFITPIASELQLSGNELRYFNELYFKSKNQNDKSIDKVLKKMNPQNWRKKKFIQPESIPATLFFALKTFSKRKIDFNIANIKSNFSDFIDEAQLEKAFENFNQKAKKTNSSDRFVTKPDNASDKVKEIHINYLDLAQRSLLSVEPERREFNSYSINIQEKEMPIIKERIRFFLDSLIEEFGDDKNADATFQLGNYLYPLTKESEK